MIFYMMPASAEAKTHFFGFFVPFYPGKVYFGVSHCVAKNMRAKLRSASYAVNSLPNHVSAKEKVLKK